jgi:hypothetical protein
MLSRRSLSPAGSLRISMFAEDSASSSSAGRDKINAWISMRLSMASMQSVPSIHRYLSRPSSFKDLYRWKTRRYNDRIVARKTFCLLPNNSSVRCFLFSFTNFLYLSIFPKSSSIIIIPSLLITMLREDLDSNSIWSNMV